MHYINFRIDLPHSEVEILHTFLKNKKIYNYIYGKEFKKDTKKEHFHAVIQTDYHRDTIKRKLAKIYQWKNTTEYQTDITKDLIKSMSYAMKDGDWTNKGYSLENIEMAKEYMLKVQQEMTLKTLKAKCLHYLNNHEREQYIMMNQELMMIILQWFKEKELTYPAQHWIKNTMITYWMQHPACEFQQVNIGKLYCINDHFIE